MIYDNIRIDNVSSESCEREKPYLQTFLSFLITASAPSKGTDPFPLGNLTFLASTNKQNISSCRFLAIKVYWAQNYMYFSGRRIEISQKS